LNLKKYSPTVVSWSFLSRSRSEAAFPWWTPSRIRFSHSWGACWKVKFWLWRSKY